MTIEDIIQTTNLPLSRKLVITLLYTSNWSVDALNEAIKPFELSLQQFNVLRILRGQGDRPANLSTINDRMVSKMSNTTRLVDKLIKKGLVHREQCLANRRKVEITITQKGLDLLLKMDPIINDTEAHITSQLNTNEIEQLNGLLNKLRQ